MNDLYLTYFLISLFLLGVFFLGLLIGKNLRGKDVIYTTSDFFIYILVAIVWPILVLILAYIFLINTINYFKKRKKINSEKKVERFNKALKNISNGNLEKITNLKI